MGDPDSPGMADGQKTGSMSNAVDFQLMGTNGRTPTEEVTPRLRRLRLPVLAPADGRIVEVTDHHADKSVRHQR